MDVKLPDIGDFKGVPIVEVLVKNGDHIALDAPVLVLESDKAIMEVPSPTQGVIQEVLVKIGDLVSPGDLIFRCQNESLEKTSSNEKDPANNISPGLETKEDSTTSVESQVHHESLKTPPYASPAVRKTAREQGVDLTEMKGSGRGGRIVMADLLAPNTEHSQSLSSIPLHAPEGAQLVSCIPLPRVDFSEFGPIERQPLTKIQQLSSANLYRNAITIPHVASFEEADITALEVFRQSLNSEKKEGGIRLTLLPFLVKAVAIALKRFPRINASLDGQDIILKHYYHIGVAVDTPKGLMVPVVRDADRKGIHEIAEDIQKYAQMARKGQLMPAMMKGGTFTISSLGAVGGTHFTPIINAPEVAILGICRAKKQPVWNEETSQFEPRLILPLSLCWNHCALDGMMAGQFNAYLANLLSDYRRCCL